MLVCLCAVARAIDEDDIGFRAPPLFYEMWDQHCDAMEAGKPGESPVVAALESATYDLDKADLRKMAIAEKLPNADQRVKADLVEELNAMLRDISYDLEYDEDCIDEELEVKVLGSFSAAAASGNPVEYIHVRSLTSTEEAVVPKFFEYDASLGPLFQANRRYLEQIQPGSTFVFVTSVGLGPDQTLVFFEARQKKDVRTASRHTRSAEAIHSESEQAYRHTHTDINRYTPARVFMCTSRCVPAHVAARAADRVAHSTKTYTRFVRRARKRRTTAACR